MTSSSPDSFVPLRPPGFGTRRPSGKQAFPLVLVEGEDAAGMLAKCVEFTASARVSETFMLSLGEPYADLYGAAPGARYEIIDHDGSFGDLLRKVNAVRAIAEHALAHGQPPVALIVDSMPAVWRLLHTWTHERARRSPAWHKALVDNPDTEVDPGHSLWKDANARHAQLMAALRRIPGVVLLVGKGRWSDIDPKTGRPLEVREWVMESQRGLGHEVTVWLRMFREQADQVIAVVHPDPQVAKPSKDEPRLLPHDWSLETLLFETLGFDPAGAETPRVVAPRVDRSPTDILADAMRSDWPRLAELRREAEPFAGVLVPVGRGQEETLGAVIARLMAERAKSDPDVVARLELDIAGADTVDGLQAVGQDIQRAIWRGQVSMADKDRLVKTFETHMQELQEQQAAADRAARETEAAEAVPQDGGDVW